MEKNNIKPDWITEEQWKTVPSVQWWEDQKQGELNEEDAKIYLNKFHKESVERKLKKIAEWKKSPLPTEIVIAQMLKNSKDY